MIVQQKKPRHPYTPTKYQCKIECRSSENSRMLHKNSASSCLNSAHICSSCYAFAIDITGAQILFPFQSNFAWSPLNYQDINRIHFTMAFVLYVCVAALMEAFRVTKGIKKNRLSKNYRVVNNGMKSTLMCSRSLTTGHIYIHKGNI